ncbi:BREX-1 system adenine-specific DNA-methyltransferase PglX [Paraburkholderia sp. BL17N1]|uniref:BREX-1 system adenine-specific DNA-methyltransferase PglX n=1 Tax=Paraburkholderia sp. BL17N1 TaxID=1938798 RepID=UPI000EAF3521|nr:BREX-1 system adenine-specific DNA-methyltransferase PglX [Paraburkholderia sp. BL17N1]RKR45949.1 N-6 DNA methylase [Paraburkholderia sp. BL17N1]
MNKSNFKAYAPQARRDFISAVVARANSLGISAKSIASADVRGDVVLIEGREWPVSVNAQRAKLIQRIQRQGFDQAVEEVTYTWFNRFAALRFMELHDYLGHGWRVLSSCEGGLPEILLHAAEVDLPGLDRTRIREMQLAGNQDNELYKLLIVAQCNDLSRSMPFLFEHIDDETELLLPDNLLRTDSIMAKLVAEVPEADWEQIEAIGWLYQFYISERKGQVMGKVVSSEDIPAATQLFTPSWIVKYLVQNSVGRLWLDANPTSVLKRDLAYYVESAEQPVEAATQLDELAQVRIAVDGGTLNPETITVFDPACGSGHILVEAYDLLKAMYLERGYRLRDIPRLILEKNLYGLDIDDRAAQLAGFALVMKARADDRRLFDDTVKLNVLALQDSQGLDEVALAKTVYQSATAIETGGANTNGQLFGDDLRATEHSSGLSEMDLQELIRAFANAKTFGSLLNVPSSIHAKLGPLRDLLRDVQEQGNALAKSYAAEIFDSFLLPAQFVSTTYDAVVTNPPYMGAKKGMNPALKRFAEKNYPDSKADLCAMFMERGFGWCKASGFNGMVTMQSWMFLPSYRAMRETLFVERSIASLIHIGYNSFPEINSKIARACAFIARAKRIPGFVGRYIDLNSAAQSANKETVFRERNTELVHDVQQDEFQRLPGGPVAYWVSEQFMQCFNGQARVEDVAPVRQGFQTGDNAKYLRYWHEVRFADVALGATCKEDVFSAGKKYVPYNKGGPYRKWFGNNDYVVRFDESAYEELSKQGNCLPSRHLYFREAITWSALSSSLFGARLSPAGHTFSAKGACAFPSQQDRPFVLALLNSAVARAILDVFAATLDFNVGAIRAIPVSADARSNRTVADNATRIVEISRRDWDSFETSWNFDSLPWARRCADGDTLAASWSKWAVQVDENRKTVKKLETENDQALIAAYGLGAELFANVPDEQITLARADRTTDCQRLISYAMGCTLGRYSLDEPGLVYAHAGNLEFNPSRYQTFPADKDGIVPLVDDSWFEDDGVNRVSEFLSAVWGPEALEENMAWLAEGLGRIGDETPDEAIRRYLVEQFFGDHLQTYKNRPIYWLFSSGPHRAFQALVYLHRYNEGTLARLRSKYVLPLTGKLTSRLEMLEKDFARAASASGRAKIQKQIDRLHAKQAELFSYGERLRHYADRRISVGLDEGVAANYVKLADLVAEVKSVAGSSDD